MLPEVVYKFVERKELALSFLQHELSVWAREIGKQIPVKISPGKSV